MTTKKKILFIVMVVLSILFFIFLITYTLPTYCFNNISKNTQSLNTKELLLNYTAETIPSDNVIVEIETTHEHTYVLKEQQNSTCSCNGFAIYICKCGKNKKEILPLINEHTFFEKEKKDPSCVANGYILYKCKECGIEQRKEIPATEKHTFIEKEIVSPTCEEQGYTILYCATCQQEKIDNIIEPLTHDWDEGMIINEATCLKTGLKQYCCRRCEKTKIENVPINGAHQFYEIQRVEPTCLLNGAIYYRCACGKEKEEVIKKNMEHKWVLKEVVNSTVTADGLKKYQCSVCHQYKEEKIDKIIQKIQLSQKKYRTVFDDLSPKLKKIAYEIIEQYYELIKSKPLDSKECIKIKIDEEWLKYDSEKLEYAFIYESGMDANAKIIQIEYCPRPTDPTFYCWSIGDSTTWAFIEDFGETGLLMVQISSITNWIQAKEYNQKQCSNILETLNDGTDLEIVQQIFNYCDSYFSYSRESAWLANLLKNKYGSCNAQSTFINMCCNLCGIESQILIGYTNAGSYHAWNRIIIDGKQTFWDATIKSIRNRTNNPHKAKTINYLVSDYSEFSDIIF